MLPLSPKSRAPAAFFSPRYRQTTVHGHLNSFNGSKCLKHIFARNALQRHQTRHQSPVQTELPKVIPLVFRLLVPLDVLGRALSGTLQSRGSFAPYLGARRGESYT